MKNTTKILVLFSFVKFQIQISYGLLKIKKLFLYFCQIIVMIIKKKLKKYFGQYLRS